MNTEEVMNLADAYAHQMSRSGVGQLADEARAALEAAVMAQALQPASVPEAKQEPVEPKCVVIVEVFGKDWRLEYMSLPVGRHKLYPQQFNYTHPTPQPDPVNTALLEALTSIAKNTCCDSCQEAARVARAAIAAVESLK